MRTCYNYIFGTPLLLLVFFSGCDSNENVEPSYDYIKFDADGESFLLNRDYSIENTYFIRGNQDQLGIVLQDAKGGLLGEIFLIDSDLLNKKLPFTVDQLSEPAYGFVQMSLVNLAIPWDTIFNETDSINYLNHSYNNFSLTINSFDDNVLKGEFNGVLKTKTGKLKLVSNGRFKAKINIVTTY